MAETEAALDGRLEGLPSYWPDAARLGWLGLHVPEEYGGQGFGLLELLIVVEELGRVVASGPFISAAAATSLLVEFVRTASPDCDVLLVQYFHRWTQRQQFLIRGTGALHEALIHISPQPLEGVAWVS
jgi:hypothetical protein